MLQTERSLRKTKLLHQGYTEKGTDTLRFELPLITRPSEMLIRLKNIHFLLMKIRKREWEKYFCSKKFNIFKKFYPESFFEVILRKTALKVSNYNPINRDHWKRVKFALCLSPLETFLYKKSNKKLKHEASSFMISIFC